MRPFQRLRRFTMVHSWIVGMALMSAVSNARWIATAQAVKVLLQFVSVAVLARLLTPHDYGLIAMVFVVGNLVSLLRDMGTAAAIVQEPELTDETKNAVFWLNVGLGTLLTIALLAGSGPLAKAFGNTEVLVLLCALAPSFLISSIGAVSRALMERKSAFSVIAAIEIATAVIGLIVTILAAWLGAGAMSFIYGTLMMALCSSAAFVIAARWLPGRIAGSERLGRLLRFSGNLSAFNLINYLARNTDAFVIGRQLGASALGIYSNAYKVMLFPLQNMTYVANRALYPVMCRQTSTAEMRSLYFKSLSTIVLLTAPLMTGIFVLREPFIDVVLGHKWHDAAAVLQWLAPVGFVQSIVSTTGTVSMVRGRTDLLLKVGAFTCALQVSAFLIGVRWGILGVAACYLLANLLGAVPALLVALHQLEARFRELVRETWASMLAALAMGSLVWYLNGYLQADGHAAPARLIAGVACGGVIYAVLVLLLAPTKMRLLFALVPLGRARAS